MPLSLTYDKGNNTAKDESSLDNGEMVASTGGFYKPGDNRLHKIGGVTEFIDTGSGTRIDGTALLQFDEGGTDKVVALSDRVLYAANLTNTGATGTSSTLKSGLGSLATSLSAAHFNDKHYLALASENLVVKSDGTTHAMSMKAPSGALLATPGQGTILIRADGDTGAFTTPGNAYDTDTDTYAHTTLSATGSVSETFRFTGTANNGSNRVISIKYALSGFPVLPDFPSDGDFDDVGGTFDSGFLVTLKFESSIDNGANFTTLLERTRTQATGELYAQADLTDLQQIQDLLLVKVTLTYTSGDTNASLFIYDVNVNDGGTAADFTTTTGIYYGVSEIDQNEGVAGPAIFSSLIIIGATKNNVKLTLPTSSNSRATHWVIYRTTDGGTLPSGLGQIDTKPIAATTYLDTFTTDKDTQTTPFLPLLRTLAQQDATSVAPIYFQQNSPAPRAVRLRAYEGSLVGLTVDQTRSLYYSMAGRPEAWPEINVIESFPFEEHDELVDCVSLGSLLVIAAKGTIMRLTSLPRVVSSVRDTSRVDQIKGAPGCVGRYALTAFSVSGAPRAAWISYYGLYITNGDSIERISDDFDWTVFDGTDKSKWVLHWDANRLCLVMSYASIQGGINDRYVLFHMSQEHRKANGQPKWTGPHYGSFDSFASGQVGNTHRLYGGHSSNGVVYVMDRGGTDASQAFVGTQLPLIATTGKAYAGDRDWAAIDGRLYHTDFGSGETCTLDWEVDSDDEDGGNFVLSQSVSLSSHKGTQLDLSQRCQWAQATITHTGSGQGAIRDLVVETAARGRVGSKRVA